MRCVSIYLNGDLNTHYSNTDALALLYTALQKCTALETMTVHTSKDAKIHFVHANIVSEAHRIALLQLLRAIDQGRECTAPVLLDVKHDIRVLSDAKIELPLAGDTTMSMTPPQVTFTVAEHKDMFVHILKSIMYL